MIFLAGDLLIQLAAQDVGQHFALGAEGGKGKHQAGMGQCRTPSTRGGGGYCNPFRTDTDFTFQTCSQ